MTERDRLIELIASKVCTRYLKDTCLSKWSGSCGECECGRNFRIGDVADHLLANGVIVPPCKVGDRLYEIVEMPKHTFISKFPIIVEPQQIIYRNIIGNHSCIPFDKIGKTVFLTREDAEKALKEMNKT